MELRMYCAYNETRECFLGLEVTAGDFSYESLSREGALTVKPSGGLWLTPFRGIPDSGVTAPIDLVCLDKQCRIVKLIESFPADCPNPSLPEVDTLLVLPEHSILLSETRVGDQVVLCVIEEMQRRLERHYTKGDSCDVDRQVEPSFVKSIGRRILELVGVGLRSEPETPRARPTREDATGNQEKRRPDSREKWTQRWGTMDLRQAPRSSVIGLQAYYWDGRPPQPHDVRDISSTGLYLLTDDRWYPGTLILMTLQETDIIDGVGEHAIPVNVRAVRWGDDGVGLEFVVANEGREPQKESYGKGIDRKELANFLRHIAK